MSTANGTEPASAPPPGEQDGGIIENLDELSLPRRKIIIFGRVISLKRVDEIGLRKWAELESVEQELNAVRQKRINPEISDAESMALLEEEISLRKKLVSEYVSEGYVGHEAEFDNMSDIQFQKLTDSFTQPPLPLPEQIAALEAAEKARQERIAAESGEDSTPETSPALTDSTESETG